jgi:hypothetical protein
MSRRTSKLKMRNTETKWKLKCDQTQSPTKSNGNSEIKVWSRESEGTEQTIELEFEGGISMSDLGFVNLGF